MEHYRYMKIRGEINMLVGYSRISTVEQNEARQLKKLKELVDVGILSEEEFNAKKKEIMGL